MPALANLRCDFKRGAEAVFAEAAGHAKQVATAVEDYAVKGLEASGGWGEVGEHAVFPRSALLRSQLEYDAAGVSSAISIATSRRAI